jgi:hypothetical protein
MLPSKIKPLKIRKASKGKSKPKASLNKPPAAMVPDQNIIEGAPNGGLSQALPTRQSTSSMSFERSDLSQKKVCSILFDFVLL